MRAQYLDEFFLDLRSTAASFPIDREAQLPVGWSEAEPHGTWAIDLHSGVVLPPARHAGLHKLTMGVSPLLAPGGIDRQRLRVALNGTHMGEFEFAPSAEGYIEIDLELLPHAIHAHTENYLFLEHPDGCRPPDLGAESRNLSFLFSFVAVVVGRRPTDAVEGMSARDILKPVDRAVIPWAKFDPEWYLRAYPTVRAALAESNFTAVLEYYLNVGQRLGHSPNLYFDEEFFLIANPEAAKIVESGDAESGFDAYCRALGRYSQPHWLFDERFYRSQLPELTEDALKDRGIANGYHHFLWVGNRLGFSPTPFFDPSYYLSQLDELGVVEADQVGPFFHLLRNLFTEGGGAACSCYFEPRWYLEQYPMVAQEVQARRWISPLHHYLSNDNPINYDPLPDFSERYYLTRYQDAQAAVHSGKFRNGYAHYLAIGVDQLRSPRSGFDLEFYVQSRPSVESDVLHHSKLTAFSHYLTVGRYAGLSVRSHFRSDVSKEQAAALAFGWANVWLPLLRRRPLNFAFAQRPRLSVVLIAHHDITLTLMSLSSLRHNYPDDIELIVVTVGPSSEARALERYVQGALHLPIDGKVNRASLYNAACNITTGSLVLFLDAGLEVAPGVLSAGIARFSVDPQTGVLGGRVLQAHGILEEAGGIIWRDGELDFYMKGASSDSPAIDFVREVDFCSGTFLMVRADLFAESGGFSVHYTQVAYSYAEFCIRMSQGGYRVVYDPALLCRRWDDDRFDAAAPSQPILSSDRDTFVRANLSYIRTRYVRDPRTELFARSAVVDQPRVLVIEEFLPSRMSTAASARSCEMVGLFVQLGIHVTLFSLRKSNSDFWNRGDDFPESVEVIHDQSLMCLPHFLRGRGGYYNTIWFMACPHLSEVLEMLRVSMVGSPSPPRIVVDLGPLGPASSGGNLEWIRSGPTTSANSISQAKNSTIWQHMVVYDERDITIPDGSRPSSVSAIGYVRSGASLSAVAPFDVRSGILFAAPIDGSDDPAFEDLCWFVDRILPIVERELGWETRLTIVGQPLARARMDRFRDHARITIRDDIDNIVSLYNTHKVFVAPVRMSSAMVVAEVARAASYGLPAVVTDEACEMLGWHRGCELLCASADDPMTYAKWIVELHRDCLLWDTVREAMLKRVAAESDSGRYIEIIRSVLGWGKNPA